MKKNEKEIKHPLKRRYKECEIKCRDENAFNTQRAIPSKEGTGNQSEKI